MVKELLAHQENIPVKPKLPMLIYEDSTPEALLSGLNENTPNGYLGSSEGGVLFNGRLMTYTAILNTLWSGDDVTVTCVDLVIADYKP